MVKREYQYESRHVHAVRRARGPGGKFLSKKTTTEGKTKFFFFFLKNLQNLFPSKLVQLYTQIINHLKDKVIDFKKWQNLLHQN